MADSSKQNAKTQKRKDAKKRRRHTPSGQAHHTRNGYGLSLTHLDTLALPQDRAPVEGTGDRAVLFAARSDGRRQLASWVAWTHFPTLRDHTLHPCPCPATPAASTSTTTAPPPQDHTGMPTNGCTKLCPGSTTPSASAAASSTTHVFGGKCSSSSTSGQPRNDAFHNVELNQRHASWTNASKPSNVVLCVCAAC